jgi:hypothetical protein
MKFVNFLEHKFGKLAIPNLTVYLIAGQVVVFFLSIISPNYSNLLHLQGNLVLEGQFWRIITFLFVPFTTSPIFIMFAWYLYYLYGTALEREWGTFRYQTYILIVYTLSVLISFIFPQALITNTYIYGSIFLAFAHLYPNFTLYLFLVIPVKVKWLSWLVWAGIINSVIFGALSAKIIALASVANYLLFFANDLAISTKTKKSQLTKGVLKIKESGTNYMKCEVCGATEKDGKIFYTCDKCKGSLSYCEDHIDNHTHIKK